MKCVKRKPITVYMFVNKNESNWLIGAIQLNSSQSKTVIQLSLRRKRTDLDPLLWFRLLLLLLFAGLLRKRLAAEQTVFYQQ